VPIVFIIIAVHDTSDGFFFRFSTDYKFIGEEDIKMGMLESKADFVISPVVQEPIISHFADLSEPIYESKYVYLGTTLVLVT